MKRNNINNSARTQPERGRQLTITIFASELILEFSVSPWELARSSQIVKVELIVETK